MAIWGAVFLGTAYQCFPKKQRKRQDKGERDSILHSIKLQDVPGFGTDGLTDAELMGTLLNGNQHDVRHAHYA